MFTNISGKIGGYQATLPLTAGVVSEIEEICANFIAIHNFVDTSTATMDSLFEWRDLFLKGEPVGDTLPAAPVFGAIGVVTGTIGIIKRFREIRELIVASPGYTEAIGEDLQIVGAEIGPTPEGAIVPDLKVTVAPAYKINVSGKMQGANAIRFEYKRNGGDWVSLGFLVKMPGSLTITPQTPGQPEAGTIRAIFVKDNQDFGNFSPEYAVTVSP